MTPVRSIRPPVPPGSISATRTWQPINVYAQNDAIPFNLSRGDYMKRNRQSNISAQNQPAGVQFERQVRVGLSLSRAIGHTAA